MLERLDDVRWAKLGDALDTHATDVPKLIRLLASKDKRKRSKAFLELSDERLVHQGQRFEASAAAVPFVLELLAAPKVEDKANLLRFLALLAVGVPDLYVLGDLGPFPTLAATKENKGVYGRCYRGVEAGLGSVTAFLDDTSMDVRASAALVVAFFAPTAVVEAAVLGRLAREKADRVRDALLLCIATWGRHFDWRAKGRLASYGERKIGPADAAFKIASVATLGDGTKVPEPLLDALERAAGLEPARDVKQPFLEGNLGSLAAAWLRRVAPERALAAMVARLGDDPGRALAAVADVVALLFPEAANVARQSVPQSFVDLPVFSRLPRFQQEALRAVARAVPATEFTYLPDALARATGLPPLRDEVLRYVGASEAGPMELPMRIGEEELPAVHWFKRFALGALSRDALIAALAALPPDRAVATCVVATSSPYGLAYTGPWDWNVAISLGVEALAPRNDVEKALLAASARILDDEAYEIWLVETCLTRIMGRSGRTVPAAHDRLIAMLFPYARPPLTDLTREILAGLPPERRDPLVLAAPLVDVLEREPLLWDRPVQPRVDGWATLDLCSNKREAAERAVAFVAGWTAGNRPEAMAIDCLAALGKDAIPVIDAHLRSASKIGRQVLTAARARLA